MTYSLHSWKPVSLPLPFTYFAHPLPCFPLGTTSFFTIFLCLILLFVCIFTFLDSTHEWNYIVSVFLKSISLNIIASRSIYVVINGMISSFFMATWYFFVCMSFLNSCISLVIFSQVQVLPLGDIRQWWEIFLAIKIRQRRHYWHQVFRGQGCC